MAWDSPIFVTLKAGDPAGPHATLAVAQEAGAVTLNWGVFINSLACTASLGLTAR